MELFDLLGAAENVVLASIELLDLAASLITLVDDLRCTEIDRVVNDIRVVHRSITLAHLIGNLAEQLLPLPHLVDDFRIEGCRGGALTACLSIML
jgi:hypothetical protein